MMNKMTVAVVLVALLAGVVGCRTIPPARTMFSEGSSSWDVEEGISKAAFDMGCAKEQLQVVDLGRVTVGVTGCGKSARYELSNGHWVPVSGKRQATPEANTAPNM